MQEYRKNLGKVSLTAEGAWIKDKSFDILSIVYDEHTLHGFISKQYVPEGVDLYNKEYWMPFNVSGYSDNNIIILSEKTSETSIKAYTLEEAINSVAVVGRRPGMILGFYNENTDRLDIGGRWEIWQFNSTTISEWEDIAHWQNIYYSFNKFVGWYRDVESLKKYNPFPEIGCYAYVGTEFNEATIYRCDTKFIWTDTTQHAWDYIKVIVQGNVTIGENGNWFNNGVDTGIPASIKGENGKTPVFRQYDNTIQYSFDNVNWITISDKVAAWFRWNATTGDTQANNVGRIQISRDNVTWTNLSGDIINKLHISRYIGADESLPTSGIAEGTIYAKGPYYAEDDTLNDNPIYRLWVYAWKGDTLAWQDNGEFTSIAAGVVQETGGSETEVMSQKAVSTKLSELGSEVRGIALSKSFNLTSGNNALYFNIYQIGLKAGDILKFKLIGNVNKYWLGAFGEDGSWEKITDTCVPNEWMFKECLLDVDSFGVWIEAADIFESGSAELLFVDSYKSSVEGSLKKRINNVEEIIKSDSYSTSHIRSGVLFTSKTPDNIKDGVYELDVYINDSIYEENKELSLDYLGKYSNGRIYIQCSNSNINIDIPGVNLPNDINHANNDYTIKGYIDWDIVGEYTKCNAIIKTKPLSSLIDVDLNNYPSINKDRQVKSVSVSQGGQFISFNIFPLEVKKGEMIRMRVDNIDASVNGNYGIYGFGENGEWVHLGDGTIGQSIITWCLGDATSVGLAIDGAAITKSGQIKVSFEKNFDTNSKAIVDIKQSLTLVKSYDYRIRSFNDKPLKYIKETPGLTSIFDTWGFIGDSLSSGEIPLSTDTTKAKDLYYYSWGQYMCRLCGSTGTNWSYGGCTTTSWLNSYGINTLDAEKKKGYIIALGTNDCNQNFEIGSKSDVDFSDYNNNVNTFFGNYCKIIQQIKSVQPSAKIFVVALPNWWTNAENKGYNSAIREIATMFENVYLIDLFTYCKNNNYIHNKYLIGGHMNTQGYLWAAYVFCTYIDWIISHNPDEFADVAYIGSEFDDGNL